MSQFITVTLHTCAQALGCYVVFGSDIADTGSAECGHTGLVKQDNSSTHTTGTLRA